MANSTANVTTAKPKVGGAIFRAPIGTDLPTSATATLDEDFEELGFVSEDGLTNSNTITSESIKSWDGQEVYAGETEKTDTFTFKLIEALRLEVLKTVYGDGNVSGDLTNGIHIKANATPQESHAWVVDMILNGGILKRIVLPNAKVTAVADIVYRSNELVGYETTLTAFPDAGGDTHHEYIVQPSEPEPEDEGEE